MFFEKMLRHRHHRRDHQGGMHSVAEMDVDVGGDGRPFKVETDFCESCAGCDTPDAGHCQRLGADAFHRHDEWEGEIDMASASIEEKLFELFHRAAHLFPRGGHHHRAGGMHPGQSRILALLAEKGPISQRDVLDIVQVRSASLSELLHKLERGGFIERERDGEDRRTVNISLTEQGKKAARADARIRGERAGAAFAALSDEEKNTLVELMDKLVGSWRQDETAEPSYPEEADGVHGRGHGRRHHHGPHHHGHHGPHGHPGRHGRHGPGRRGPHGVQDDDAGDEDDV